MEKGVSQNLKNAWRNTNNATIGFAKNTPIKEWNKKPFDPRFKPFSWEFACLARSRMCYLKALKTGKLNFSNQKDIPNKATLEKYSKRKLIEKLESLSKEILKRIDRIQSSYDIEIVSWLLQHERIHHGKLILYHSKMGFKLPSSFVKTWGESNFESA